MSRVLVMVYLLFLVGSGTLLFGGDPPGEEDGAIGAFHGDEKKIRSNDNINKTGCKIHNLKDGDGDSVEYIEDLDGSIYFLPELYIIEASFEDVSAYDGVKGFFPTRFGDLKFSFEMTQKDGKNLEFIKKEKPSVINLFHSEKARVIVNAQTKSTAKPSVNLIRVKTEPTLFDSVYRECAARKPGDLLLGIHLEVQLSCGLIRTGFGLEKSKSIFLKEGEKIRFYQKFITFEFSVNSVKDTESFLDLLGQYDRLKEKDNNEDFEKCEKMKKRAIKVLFEKPTQNMDDLLSEFNLSKEEAIDSILEQTRGISLRFFSKITDQGLKYLTDVLENKAGDKGYIILKKQVDLYSNRNVETKIIKTELIEPNCKIGEPSLRSVRIVPVGSELNEFFEPIK